MTDANKGMNLLHLKAIGQTCCFIFRSVWKSGIESQITFDCCFRKMIDMLSPSTSCLKMSLLIDKA